ncbi:MAG: hypothetical protein SchgKO_16640 [Schleiferiaceae bacterium]
MEHTIVGPSVKPHQKVILIGCSLAFFAIGFPAVWVLIEPLYSDATVPQFPIGGYMQLLLFVLSPLLFLYAFTRDGVSQFKDTFRTSTFLFGKPIRSITIDPKDIEEITVLQFNMKQKVAMTVAPNPDQAYDYVEYRVYGLNENHSKRTLIYKTQDQKIAKLITEIAGRAWDAPYVQYNPPVSKGRRGRR